VRYGADESKAELVCESLGGGSPPMWKVVSPEFPSARSVLLAEALQELADLDGLRRWLHDLDEAETAGNVGARESDRLLEAAASVERGLRG
jgi:hypothetical protein